MISHASILHHLRKALYVLLGVGLIAGSTSCRKRPAGVLDDKKMESLLTDMLLAEAYEQSSLGRTLPDSVRRTLGERVLKAHGVDYATLDSTYMWYSKNLDDYYKLYGNVEKRLQKQSRKLSGVTKEAEVHKQNDIWALPNHIAFSSLGDGETLVFEFGGDAIAPGEQLEWKMTLSNGIESRMLLGIDYTDGRSRIIEKEFHANRTPSLKLTGDTVGIPARLYGVMIIPRRNMPVYADSISLVKYPFDSVEYTRSWNQRLFYPPRRKQIQKPVLPTDSVSVDSHIAK